MRDAVALKSEEDVSQAFLKIAPNGKNSFIGQSTPPGPKDRIFGGKLLGEALLAAVESCTDMPVSSFHAYFLLRGNRDLPVEYRVEVLRDSRRFANRMVSAVQGDAKLMTLMCEFHVPEDGFAHQLLVMPDVPAPETLPPLQTFVQDHADRLDPAIVHNFKSDLPVDMRVVDPEAFMTERGPARRGFWFRIPAAMDGKDGRYAQCLLAYASDYWLAGVGAIPHMVPTNSADLLLTSLDHAMWFHRAVPLDDWLFYDTDSPSAGDGLALGMGRIYARDGTLIASTAQEALMRRLNR